MLGGTRYRRCNPRTPDFQNIQDTQDAKADVPDARNEKGECTLSGRRPYVSGVNGFFAEVIPLVAARSYPRTTMLGYMKEL